MAVKIIGIVIGALVLGASVFYLVKEKDDKDSKKIYGTLAAIGGIVAVVCAVLLAF